MDPGGRCVLVVEDNADHAVLVRLAVERADPDVDVRVVSRGEVAITSLREGGGPKPDLVILDLLLPGMRGFEVLERMARDGEADGIPVVVLTSSVNPGDRDRALSSGARAFYSKPPDLYSLGETVAEILERWLP